MEDEGRTVATPLVLLWNLIHDAVLLRDGDSAKRLLRVLESKLRREYWPVSRGRDSAEERCLALRDVERLRDVLHDPTAALLEMELLACRLSRCERGTAGCQRILLRAGFINRSQREDQSDSSME